MQEKLAQKSDRASALWQKTSPLARLSSIKDYLKSKLKQASWSGEVRENLYLNKKKRNYSALWNGIAQNTYQTIIHHREHREGRKKLITYFDLI